jgi:hypothetical protein
MAVAGVAVLLIIDYIYDVSSNTTNFKLMTMFSQRLYWQVVILVTIRKIAVNSKLLQIIIPFAITNAFILDVLTAFLLLQIVVNSKSLEVLLYAFLIWVSDVGV